ncbi:MAG: DUF4245 domain-containing protein [Micromonosporaceae bacterium]|nr:DUF4245 domain-containing protein [Micromonosporaceae bacterium]
MHQPTIVFRLIRSFRAHVAALAVVLIVAFVVVGFVRLLGRQDHAAVDTSAAYGAAKAAGAFPVASPRQLPDGWRALGSDFQPDHPAAILRVSLRAPDGGAVQLIQSAWPAASLLPEELGVTARRQGTVDVAGRGWQWYLGEGGRRALVLLETDRTIILVGTAADRDLRAFAGTLA